MSEVGVQCRPWNEGVYVRKKNESEIIVWESLKQLFLKIPERFDIVHISVADQWKHWEMELF